MPILSFNKKFITPIESGRKTQTIRAFRKYPIEPHSKLYLYTALRTKHSRKLGEAIALAPVKIEIKKTRIIIHEMMKMVFTDPVKLNRLAKDDGFADWQEMKAWWLKTHGLPFTGILIKWYGFEKTKQNARP